MNQVEGIAFATIYVDDYPKALAFYQKHFGYEIKYPMSEHSSWGMAGTLGIYIEGGNSSVELNVKTARASIVFSVKSAHAFYQQLKQDSITMIQPAPKNMGGGDYWFQFKDTSGNILEALGGE